MRLLRTFIFVLMPFAVMAFALSSCGGGDDTSHTATTSATYTAPANPGGRLCTLQCSEANNYCHESCDLHQRKCVSEIQARALQDYESYTRAQFASHSAIDLHPRDFERMGSCDSDKASCTADCENNFQQCYTRCGGTVTKTTSCQSFCF